jgi:tetratricopeptide (TPR) repeat protein
MSFFEKIKFLQNSYESRNYKKVIEHCRVLTKKLPKNSFILNLMGMSYQGLLRHNEAINCFNLALKADSKNIASMNNLANSFKHVEKFEIAEEIYKKILKINPNYINAYNNYAKLIKLRLKQLVFRRQESLYTIPLSIQAIFTKTI